MLQYMQLYHIKFIQDNNIKEKRPLYTSHATYAMYPSHRRISQLVNKPLSIGSIRGCQQLNCQTYVL
jgi:hypothetical protein